MKYLLDTSAVIALLKKEPVLLTWLRREMPAAFGLPAIVLHELHYGAERSRRREQNLADLALLPFDVVSVDADDARAAGEIRASLEREGQSIGPYDLLIAGQALTRGLTLVSRNLREFSRIRGMQVVEGR